MCETCKGLGFVKLDGAVSPCPRCNPDSGYEGGQYEAELVAKHGRCGYSKGGGGRTCPRYSGHPGGHIFMCGH